MASLLKKATSLMGGKKEEEGKEGDDAGEGQDAGAGGEASKALSAPGGAPSKKGESASVEVGTMKSGDYMIHVFIEQARQLKVPEGNTVDPLIEVSVLNEKKFTTTKDDVGASGTVSWNEHLFFEPKNVSVNQIEEAKITIKMLDKGYFKQSIIGQYEFDVAWVYFHPKRSFLHKWIVLSNPESATFNEVAGYLKLSISVATVGDEQIQITEDTGADNSEDILMPPSIQPEFYQIRFKFFHAEHLPAMDKGLIGKGSIDAYIHAQYLSYKLNTQVLTVKEGDTCYWNQQFMIPCQVPLMSTRVVMKVMDKDLVKDEVVGSILFNLKECMNELNGKFFWKNIYGCPVSCSGANSDMMNSNPEVASTWKGRVLMQVTSMKTEKPQCKQVKISKEEVEGLGKFVQNREFDVIAEVGQGLALPSESKYKVMIKIAEFQLVTGEPAYQEGNYNRWKHRFPQQTLRMPYVDVKDIGKVYIYLMSGNDPVCYYVADIEKFTNPNPEFQWIEMIPDLALGKVKESHKAGVISIKLSIHDKTKDGEIDFKRHKSWANETKKNRIGVKIVRANVFQCRDLPAADDNGQSDPFIKIWDCTNKEKKTKVIDDNNNPLFYEYLDLTMEGDNIDEMPPFILDIYDKDLLSNDFIARSLIKISDMVYNQERKAYEKVYIAAFNEDQNIMRPKWHPCKMTPNSPAQGEVLVSFSIVEFDFTFTSLAKLSDMVPRSEYELDINILGLRDLQSAGILPVKKAFIVFNLKSLIPPDDGRAIANIQTQPNSPGANPTINTLIKFKVPLPDDKLFQPRLLCTVHDYIFKGFNQPLLGSFIIPVGDLIDKLKDERARETKAIEDILKALMEIIEDRGIPSYNREVGGGLNKQLIQDPNSEYTETFEAQYEIREEERKSLIGRDSMKKAKASIKVDRDAQMKRPLLNLDEESSVQAFGGYAVADSGAVDVAAMMASPRVNTRSLTIAAAGGAQSRATMKNPLKAAVQVDKFSSGMKGKLLEEQKEAQDKKERILEDQRNRDAMDMKGKLGDDSVRNIILARYSLDKRLQVEREVKIPPATLFLGVGSDLTPNASTKHYRRFYPKELELVPEVMTQPSPFDSYELKRGQSRGASKSWWSFGGAKKVDESGQASTEQVVGKFKGVVSVQTKEEREKYQEYKSKLLLSLKKLLNTLSQKKIQKPFSLNMELLDTMEGRKKIEMELEKLDVAHLNITKCLGDLESDETLKRLLLQQAKCIVRVYIIDAFNLSSRDNGGDSDPYLVVGLGNKVFNDRDNYQTDQPNPKFFKVYDFESVFPGCAPLTINVMDYDEIFGDDSIGTTTIDLEDRYFSPEWQSIEEKPIELRSLYHPSSAIAQGTVRMWVEIHSLQSGPLNEVKKWDIKPSEPEDFEIRVCVFNTQDIPCDDPEGVSDVYLRAFFDSKGEVKETDTHYRCGDGKASFNYRLLFKHSFPRPDPSAYNLSLQVYDRDLLTSNDVIGETMINIKEAVEDASLTKKAVNITKKYYESYLLKEHEKKYKAYKIKFEDANTFWVDTSKRNDKTGKMEYTGKVRLQIDVLPKDFADKNKVGDARQEPNHSPFLKPPEGRLELSMNPLKMLGQMVGPDLRRKIKIWLFCGSCIALCIMLLPLVAGNLISALILKLFP